MQESQVIIIGGGLAGLTAAIHLRRSNIEVILFEKQVFPHHKVCGEYLSKEVIPYLEFLQIDLKSLGAVTINSLQYSTTSGKSICCPLEMGGLGISRYTLDHFLYKTALNSGCTIMHSVVTDVNFKNEMFEVITAEGIRYSSEFVLGAYGKRSALDKKLKRPFIQKQSGWLAVKAHYRTTENIYPEDLVSLHNFNGGYCGLSRTDMNSVNVCYLADYKSFKGFSSTQVYREQVLMKNPFLNSFFMNSKMLFEKELSIGQVSFEKKSIIQEHILMLGDAAGLIHPLCGNGMAMAIHSAKILSEELTEFYKKRSRSRKEVETAYLKSWRKNFNYRMKAGSMLQKILLNRSLSGVSQAMIKNFPGALPAIIKTTHGKTF